MFDVLRIVCSIIRVRVQHYFLLAPNTQPLTQATDTRIHRQSVRQRDQNIDDTQQKLA